MPAEDLLKFKVDITDVEAKLARIKALQEEVQKTRAGGGDASKLEDELKREITAFGRLGQSGKEAKGPLDELVRSKRDIAGAAELAGARIGGLLGNFGDLFQVIASGNVTLIATTAVITAGTLAWQALAGAAKEAADNARAYSDAAAAANRVALDKKGGVAQRLLALGAATGENVEAAEANSRALAKKYGLSGPQADQAVTVSTAAGESDLRKIAALTTFLTQRGNIGDGQESIGNARKFFNIAGAPSLAGIGPSGVPIIAPPAIDAYEQQALSFARSAAGVKVRNDAAKERGSAQPSATALTLDRLDDGVKNEFKIKSEEDLRQRLREYAEAQELVNRPPLPLGDPLAIRNAKKRAKATIQRLQPLVNEEGLSERILDGAAPTAGPATPAPGQPPAGARALGATTYITNIVNTTNQGTVYNAPDRKRQTLSKSITGSDLKNGSRAQLPIGGRG